MTHKDNKSFNTIILGAGAAGLFCAVQLSQKGIKTLLLEHNDRPGKKILISGGGRCNFTNTGAMPANYLSQNPHFFKSALACYKPEEFLDLIKKYNIPYFEKKAGQLFCQTSSKEILRLLLGEINNEFVTQLYNCSLESVDQTNSGFCLQTNKGVFESQHLVIATGGLSFATLGASPLGYKIAKQFGLNILDPRPGLVPFECDEMFKKTFGKLSGLSFNAKVSVGKTSFTDDVLITHAGLSGPAILQISSYWRPGNQVVMDLLPSIKFESELKQAKASGAKQALTNYLSKFWPERFVTCFLQVAQIDSKPINELADKTIQRLAQQVHHWSVLPVGTLGYTKAEVTLGGVDTKELSSQTLESKKIPGLYFIGEVVDVTGWLGGYNFQWAWASATQCALAIKNRYPP